MPLVLTSDDWFVARIQTRRERWAAENIARAGAFYYSPEIIVSFRVQRFGHRIREYRTEYLFPGYMFVRHPDQQWHFLLSMRVLGVLGIIQGANGKPGRIPNQEIERLKKSELDGKVQLPAATNKFGVNQLVRINRGAYAGFTGLVQGNHSRERVQVLLDFMNRKVSHMFGETVLEAA